MSRVVLVMAIMLTLGQAKIVNMVDHLVVANYSGVVLTGYSSYETATYTLLNQTGPHLCSYSQNDTQIMLTSPGLQPIMNLDDFMFRVFSQRMYMYSLVLRTSSQTSLATGHDVLTEIMVDLDGLQRLNGLGVGVGMEVEVYRQDQSQMEIILRDTTQNNYISIHLTSPATDQPHDQPLSPDSY